MDKDPRFAKTLAELIPPLNFYLDAAYELHALAVVIDSGELKADSIEDRFAREAARLFPERPVGNHRPAAELVHRMIHERMDATSADPVAGTQPDPEFLVTRWSERLTDQIVAITGDPDDYWRYSEVWSRVTVSKWGSEVLQSSLLMSAIADFEVFIARYVRSVLELRPEILRASDRKYTYRELEAFSSIDEARAKCAQDLVDGLLRGGYEDWTAWLQKQGVSVAGVTQDPSRSIIEAFQRRHLFVHNGGVVNEYYLAKVDNVKAPPLGTPGCESQSVTSST